jgi:hypothetical protein
MKCKFSDNDFGGLKALTVVLVKSSSYWDIQLYTPLKVNRNFEGTCHLHPQGREISQARQEHEAE